MFDSPFAAMDQYELGMTPADLVKSLTSGYPTDISNMTGGDALKVEYMDSVLHDVSFNDKHVRFFKALKTRPLTSNVAEWAKRAEYGSPYGATAGAGDNPVATNADLARMFGFAKYYRTLRGVDHPTSVIRNIVNAIAEEEVAGTKYLLGHIERDLFFGDSGIVDEQFDGLLPQILANGESNCVIDMAGTAFVDQAQLHDAAAVIGSNGGSPTHLFIDSYSSNDLDKALSAAQRFVIPANVGQGGTMIDTGISGFRSGYGETQLAIDLFLNPERGWFGNKTNPIFKAAAVTRGGSSDAAVPATPVIGGAVVGGSGGEAPAGTYYYKVSAINANGESAATAATSATITAGQKVTLTVTHTDATTKGFRVYRSAVDAADGTDCRYLYQFAAETDGSTDIVDGGEWVPGTCCAFIVDIDPVDPAVDWMQLLPMTKLPLGIRRPRQEWLQMIYGFLRLTKPWRAAVIKNILPSQIKAGGWNPLGSS